MRYITTTTGWNHGNKRDSMLKWTRIQVYMQEQMEIKEAGPDHSTSRCQIYKQNGFVCVMKMQTMPLNCGNSCLDSMGKGKEIYVSKLRGGQIDKTRNL